MIVGVPPAVVQIAQRAKREEQGIVVYRLHRIFDVHAGPMHRHDELELAVVSQDGHAVKVRVLRALTNGKAAGETAMAQIENRYEHPKAGDVFHRPFDSAYLSEYTYRAVDAHIYRFTSTMRDSSHGDGTFWVDVSGNVVKYQYVPNALPPYATSGTVTDERSQVLPDRWFLTREEHAYAGRYLIFSGGAKAAITYDSFTAYPDLQSAFAALQTIRM